MRFLQTSILLLLLTTSCSKGPVSDWLGPDRNGRYPELGLLSEWPGQGPELAWQFNDLNMGHSSPAFWKEEIYITGMPDSTTGYLYCLDLDGKLLWKTIYGDEFKTNYTGSRSTPVIAGRELYIMSGEGEIVCFDLHRRKKRWSIDILPTYSDSLPTYGHAQSPVIDKNRLYCCPGGKSHAVICLDRKSGKLIWSCEGKGSNPSYSSPILIDHKGQKIIVAVTENEILGIDSRKGILKWSVPFESVFVAHINTPVYKNGIIYMATQAHQEKGGLIAIQLNHDGAEASVLWERNDIRNPLSGIMIEDNLLFTSIYRKKDWLSLDPLTGETKASWTGPLHGNLTYADERLYILSHDGDVGLGKVTHDTIEILGTFKPDINIWDPFGPLWSFPVIKDKVLYIRHKENLFAYNIGSGS